jgi:hypothetical protein
MERKCRSKTVHYCMRTALSNSSWISWIWFLISVNSWININTVNTRLAGGPIHFIRKFGCFCFFCGRFVWRIRGSFVLLEPGVTGRFLSDRYCRWIPVKFTRTTRANIHKDVMLWSEQNPSYVIANECRYAIFRVIAPSFIVRNVRWQYTHIGRSTQFPSLCQRSQTIESQNRQSANNLWTTFKIELTHGTTLHLRMQSRYQSCCYREQWSTIRLAVKRKFLFCL